MPKLPIAYICAQCRLTAQRQAVRSPLQDAERILENQFRELNDALARMLRESAAATAAAPVPVEKLRAKLAVMMGAWPLSRSPRTRWNRISRSEAIEVRLVEWEVADGVNADGILILPRCAGPVPAVLCIPDCSESPEDWCGRNGTAIRLAKRGFSVLALRLISRTHPPAKQRAGNAGGTLNNRRHLHRLGWQLGRPLLGAEVAMARSAISVLQTLDGVDPRRIGVAGCDQGGHIALLSAALDARINAAVVSRYFGWSDRPEWQPVDRLIFGQARWLSDVALAGMIAPRGLCIESDPHGRWPRDADARTEIERTAQGFTRQIDFETARRLAGKTRAEFVASPVFCSERAVRFLERHLDPHRLPRIPNVFVTRVTDLSGKEMARFAEMERCFRRRLQGCKARRIRRWTANRKKFDAYLDILGRFPQRPRRFAACWKLALDTHRLIGCELMLDVYDGLRAYGILLVPKDIRPGECRAAVVCQHGFQGQPWHAVGFHTLPQAAAYNMFGARLAERGYVVFCPYLCVPDSETRTRLVKKAWLLGGMPIGLEAQKFSRAVDFLESLPFVDGRRIGFYGLSYGGYTALWFTPFDPRFKAVVCSGHFNDWQRKTTDLTFKPSCYLYHPDEDMYNFDLLEQMDHVMLATLRAPRPFAVEAGTRDGVFRIKWVRREFRRVKAIYHRLGAAEKAQLFEFDGPHEVCGKDTFPFLDRWLRHQPKNP